MNRTAHTMYSPKHFLTSLGLASAAISLPLAASAKPPADVPTIQIAATQVKAKVSPMLYGLMTEEINFSYEGGLYGELIRNRSFKGEAGYAYQADEPVYWSAVGGAEISLDKNTKLNEALDLSLLLNAKGASPEHPVGISNPGFWGIPLSPDTPYTVSFYAKAEAAGPIAVALAKQDGSVITSATVTGVSG
jgi:alpha-N-arabinofuranosidase